MHRWMAIGLVLALGLGVPAGGAPPEPSAAGAAAGPVQLDFFFAGGCDECRAIDRDVLPGLLDLAGEWVDLRRHDITSASNYLRLAAFQDRLGVRANDRVSFVADGRRYIGGLETIRTGLVPIVEALVFERLDGAPTAAGPEGARDAPAPPAVLERRLAAWTVPAVALAGLLDGLNPCAFATLLFFVSLLAAGGARRGALLTVGAAFCGAVFVTYLGLGFGLLRAAHWVLGRAAAGGALRWALAALLAVLSALSFRDAWIFRRTGRAAALALQLPARVRDRVHAVLRRGVSVRSVALGSAAAGVLVTLLESACTGQWYVPTLVLLSRRAETAARAAGLLLLYNLMFVVPHLLVFLAAYRGLTNARLLAWSRGHVVWSKLALGFGFAALSALLAWT